MPISASYAAGISASSCSTDIQQIQNDSPQHRFCLIPQTTTSSLLIVVCLSVCRNLQDPNAPVSTQGTSIKLLHSVVEVMFARHTDRATADSYRVQLGRILDVFVSKLSFMRSQIPKLLAAGLLPPPLPETAMFFQIAVIGHQLPAAVESAH